MKIDGYTIQQQSQRHYTEHSKENQSMEVWVDKEQKPGAAGSFKDALELSQTALQLLEVEEQEDLIDEHMTDGDRLKIKLLEMFVTYLTGKEFKFNGVALGKLGGGKGKNPYQAPTGNSVKGQLGQTVEPQRQGWGIRYDYSREHYEREVMSFKSEGVVRTADGREIDFELNLNMSREYYERSSIQIRAGDALIDPLVINMDGRGMRFGDEKIRLDINLDGQVDDIPALEEGSGYLVLDRNSNGRIDDGLELFGPQSGNGFNELRLLDEDGNQWIDENDAVFDKLQIWSVDADGVGRLIGLKDADVGAIYLGSIGTEYQLKDSENSLQGKIRESSVFLHENGKAGVIHEIDIKI